MRNVDFKVIGERKFWSRTNFFFEVTEIRTNSKINTSLPQHEKFVNEIR